MQPDVIPIRPHALCSPSSSDRWLPCAGSIAMEDGEPDQESAAAADGTQEHTWGETWLRTGHAPADMPADSDAFARVESYVRWVQQRCEVWDMAGAKVALLVEQRMPLVEVTGERNAFGTADAIILAEFNDHTELDVVDYKSGYHEVDSDAPQLKIYGIAAMRQHGLMHNITKVHTTVVQPRVRSEPNTVEHDASSLEAFAAGVMERAQLALQILEDGPTTALSHLTVTEKGCKWCKAQHKCPAKVRQIHETVYGELQDLTEPGIMPMAEDVFDGPKADFEKLLPLFMQRVPEIEAWCKYVRAKVEQLLVEGKHVAGFKLVQGRAGARKWVNEDAVRAVCTGNRVDKALWQTLPEVRTPADFEKKVKKAHPDVWQAVQTLITQSAGSPSVAPADDPRPTLGAPAFDGESYDAGDLV